MSPKILSKAGESLADLYDVKGSVAGVEELNSRDVGLQHEMGGTIFSERLRTDIIRNAPIVVAQNVTTDDTYSSFFVDRPSRIMSIEMLTDDESRLLQVTMAIRTSPTQEIPIWAWQLTDQSLPVRFIDAGSSATMQLLINQMPMTFPSMLVGDQNRVPRLGIHFISSGFGAGTVSLTTIIHTLHVEEEGISSHGLPLPSW